MYSVLNERELYSHDFANESANAKRDKKCPRRDRVNPNPSSGARLDVSESLAGLGRWEADDASSGILDVSAEDQVPSLVENTGITQLAPAVEGTVPLSK